MEIVIRDEIKDVFNSVGVNDISSFIEKWAAPTTQDATQPTDKIRDGEKVCFLRVFAGY